MSKISVKQEKPALTQAQADAIKSPDELIRELNDLRALLEQKDQEIEALQNQTAPAATGRGGWLVTTKNQQYNGTTAGIQFRGGRAFIPDGAGAEETAKMLKNDFSYQVEYVQDWQQVPAGAQVRRSFIDVLSGGPQ